MNLLKDHEKAVTLKVHAKDAISALRKASPQRVFKGDYQGVQINWYALGLNNLDTEVRNQIIDALVNLFEKDLQKILDKAEEAIEQSFQLKTKHLLNEATAIVQELNPSALKPEQEPVAVEVYVNH